MLEREELSQVTANAELADRLMPVRPGVPESGYGGP
jgi:hypothetical protein